MPRPVTVILHGKPSVRWRSEKTGRFIRKPKRALGKNKAFSVTVSVGRYNKETHQTEYVNIEFYVVRSRYAGKRTKEMLKKYATEYVRKKYTSKDPELDDHYRWRVSEKKAEIFRLSLEKQYPIRTRERRFKGVDVTEHRIFPEQRRGVKRKRLHS